MNRHTTKRMEMKRKCVEERTRYRILQMKIQGKLEADMNE